MSACRFLHVTPNRPGAIAIIQLVGSTDPVLRELTDQESWPIGRMRLVNFSGIDEGLAGRITGDIAQLMPHGGMRVVQRLIAKLLDLGVEPANESSLDPMEIYPESSDRYEAIMLGTLARAQSPLAVNLLLDQPRRWRPRPRLGRPITKEDRARSARLNRLIDPPIVVLAGPPNVGKSTLSNALLGRSMSIAIDMPGTTRDYTTGRIELAVRIARTVTGRRDAIVLENAYHGNTQTLVDLSPYKCEGPGGAGRPEGVHKVEMPDPYRGTHRGRGEDAGIAYAEELRKLCERLVAGSRPPALYIVEPIVACGGQVVPPSGYLKHAFEHVRAVGGLCIADEVQVGMGRAGSHWCVFESMEATPDIVTLGKPIGNGHPLGAVITTSEIAAAFDTGMEYFSTFGGNPVSMAVGMAVMDVIEEEELMPRAERVGAYITAGFRELAQRHPMIGDVRGVGLFMGIELVRDRLTLQPATEETARLIELVKADDILLSAEGPHHNVLKIKPPMQFDETDADLLINAVDRALTTIVEE